MYNHIEYLENGIHKKIGYGYDTKEEKYLYIGKNKKIILI